jgi:aminopeptidase N
MTRVLSGLLFISVLFVWSCKTSKLNKNQDDWSLGNMLDTVDVKAFPGEFKGSAKRDFDLLHTKLEVSFDFEKKHLLGKANLTLKPYFYPSDELVLDAKGFNINKVALVKNGASVDLKFEYKDSLQLHIILPSSFTRNDTLEIMIDYVAKPDERTTGGSNAITSDKGLYFINPEKKNPLKPVQIWTQGETESSSCWFPTIDKPNEKTTGEICITVADTMTTLSNGEMTESTVHADGTKTECWTMEKPHAPYLFMMAIGKYSVTMDKWRGKEVSYYVEPKFEKYARSIFGNTPEMLEFFSQKLGYEYPWNKYAQVVVRDYVSGAMENTTASVFLEAIQTTDRERLDRNWDFIIAHELFHQWFGDLVTCESWANITMNEGFATYSEYLWNEHKYGIEEADYHLMGDLKKYLGESRIYQEPLIRHYHEEREEVFDSHSYEKGGLTLHMLRKYVGDEAFFKSLQLYLKTNEYKPVEVHQLRLAFEEVTGEDLNWFFNQWYLTAGHPKLTINYEYSDSLKKQYVMVKQNPSTDKSRATLYRLPVKVDIYTETGVERKEILIDSKEHKFEFDVTAKPKLVNFDAEKILLCQKEDNKTDEEFIYQFYNAKNVIDRHEVLLKLWSKQDKEEVKKLFTDAIKDKHWSVREYAVKKLDMDDSTARKEYYETLKAVAIKDSKSQVRAAAIEKINDYEKDLQLKILYETINDSSFLVAGKSLKALLKIDTLVALENAKKFEQFENSEMTGAVGSVYAEAGAEDKQVYFEHALKTREGYALYYLINDYADYLLRMNQVLAQSGARTLKDIALNNESWWYRTEAGTSVYDIMKKYQGKLEDKEEELKKATPDKLEQLTAEKNGIELFVKNLQADFEEIKTAEKEKKATERYEKLN